MKWLGAARHSAYVTVSSGLFLEYSVLQKYSRALNFSHFVLLQPKTFYAIDKHKEVHQSLSKIQCSNIIEVTYIKFDSNVNLRRSSGQKGSKLMLKKVKKTVHFSGVVQST